MLESKKFYHVKEYAACAFYITSRELEPLPLLLEIQGLYFMFPKQVVENAVECLKDISEPTGDRSAGIYLSVDQAIEVPAKVAKFLLGEEE